MDNNYELHNITMNPILNQSLNESMSSSQSFLLSKSMVDEPIPKLPHKDPNKTLTLDEIIKDYKNAFIYVLDFLTLNDKIIEEFIKNTIKMIILLKEIMIN